MGGVTGYLLGVYSPTMAHEHIERVNKDRLALADELVKAWRAESPPASDEEIVLRLRERVRPRLADKILDLVAKGHSSRAPDVFHQPIAKDGTGEIKTVLPQGVGSWAPLTAEARKSAETPKLQTEAEVREDQAKRFAEIRRQRKIDMKGDR